MYFNLSIFISITHFKNFEKACQSHTSSYFVVSAGGEHQQNTRQNELTAGFYGYIVSTLVRTKFYKAYNSGV